MRSQILKTISNSSKTKSEKYAMSFIIGTGFSPLVSRTKIYEWQNYISILNGCLALYIHCNVYSIIILNTNICKEYDEMQSPFFTVLFFNA